MWTSADRTATGVAVSILDRASLESAFGVAAEECGKAESFGAFELAVASELLTTQRGQGPAFGGASQVAVCAGVGEARSEGGLGYAEALSELGQHCCVGPDFTLGQRGEQVVPVEAVVCPRHPEFVVCWDDLVDAPSLVEHARLDASVDDSSCGAWAASGLGDDGIAELCPAPPPRLSCDPDEVGVEDEALHWSAH